MKRTIKPWEFKKLLGNSEKIQIIDVRRKEDYDADKRIITNAIWRDPDKVDSWGKTLSGVTDTVVYCIDGESVSSTVINLLQEAGIEARYIEGGLKAWVEISGDITTRG